MRLVAVFQLRVLCAGLFMYRVHVGRFPDDREGVVALWDPPADDLAREKWHGPYITSEDLMIDPWGRLYAYAPVDGPAMFDLRSLGADGVVSGDDIVAADITPEFFAELRAELARYTPGPTLPKQKK
jgi:general secretion pathway protein G